MQPAYVIMAEQQVYDPSSAMLWLYFVMFLGFIVIVLAWYQRIRIKMEIRKVKQYGQKI